MIKRILTYTALALMFAGLTGCGSTRSILLTETDVQVIEPSKELFVCPTDLPMLPSEAQRTDRDRARLFAKLSENNRICAASMEKVQEFLENAKIISEEDNLD